jgi:hypothetical protein
MQIVITEPMIDGEHREVGSRLVREEDSIGSDITITHTPSIKELANHMSEMKDAYRAKYARGILLFTNVLSLIFACLMIYFGSTHNGRTKFSTANEAFSTMGQELANLGKYTANEAEHYFEGMFDPTEGYVKNILRPYQLVLALGVSLLMMSLAGLLGSACPTRRVGKEILFAYFSTVLVFVCVLLWGSVMCFQYQNETKRFLDYAVESNWKTIQPLVDARKKHVLGYVDDNSNLIISGSFCIVSAVVMTIGLWAASKTMGHYFTVKKIMVSCSISGVFSGLVLMSLSIYYGAKSIGGAWAPAITAVSGVAILLLSLLGIYGVKAESLLALVLHLVLVSMLSLFVSVVGVFVIAYPHIISELVHKNWAAIKENVMEGTERHFRSEIADNLLLLGSASLLFAVLLLISAAASFSTCLETYQKKKSVVLGKIEIKTI